MHQTPIARRFEGVKVEKPEDPAKPTILHIAFETEIGPLVLRITEITAGKLMQALKKHPVTRGYA